MPRAERRPQLIDIAQAHFAWRMSQPQCTAEMATELVMALTWSGLERIAATNLPARASSKTLSRAV